jgi:hypothetical protein
MKATLIITALSAFTHLASARSTKRDFSQTDVQNFVTLWATDVSNVNDFLNGVFQGTLSANDPATLQSNAQLALTFATDEPMELMRLGSLPGLSGQGVQAAMNLMQVFGTEVIDNLNKIIANPGDAATVTAAVDGINTARCFNVLPDLCNLWPASFTAVGLDPAQAGKPFFEAACPGVYQNAGLSPLCQGAEPVIQTTT